MLTCLNLACGKNHKSSTLEELWINVDSIKANKPDALVNLFRLPYPWKTNSIDKISVEHFIEHIPHSLKDWNIIVLPWEQERRRLLNLDGLIAFFDECYRILKPDGEITVVAPHAWSKGAMQDPTHTRYIVPATFSYFAAQDPRVNFDYGSKARFEIISDRVGFGNWGMEYSTAEENEEDVKRLVKDLNWNMAHLVNVANILTVTMRAVK